MDTFAGGSNVKGRDVHHIFKATKRETDGKIPVVDLIMEAILTIALLAPEPHFTGKIEIKWQGANNAAALTVDAVLRALFKKHLHAVDSHGNNKEMGKIARELVLDILANKPDWKKYSGIFAAFAERNDRDFFERLVRGIQRKRKPVFEPIDWFCLLNWHEWNDVSLPPGLEKFPPLKFWTDETALGLLAYRFGNETSDFKLDVSGLRTKRTRLALKQSKPAQVTVFDPVHGKPGFFRVGTPN